MDFVFLSILAVGLILVTSLFLLLSRDWRWGILALAGQYTGVTLLVWVSWPLEMAVVKLVAGWMAGAVLGTTRITLSEVDSSPPDLVERLFRLLSAGLVLLVVFSVAPRVVAWVPEVSLEQVWGALILISMGLLHLGFTARAFRVILGLLTVLSGFEVIYAAVENSTLVAGMLAGINLGMALLGAYLLAAPSGERVEAE
jgi:hypothetical protein